MRCAKCAHTWHQMPESLEDMDLAVDPEAEGGTSEEGSDSVPPEAAAEAASDEVAAPPETAGKGAEKADPKPDAPAEKAAAEKPAAKEDSKADKAQEAEAEASVAEDDGGEDESDGGSESATTNDSDDDADLISALGLMAEQQESDSEEAAAAGDDDVDIVDISDDADAAKAQAKADKKAARAEKAAKAMKALHINKPDMKFDMAVLMSDKSKGYAVNYGGAFSVFILIFLFLVITKGIWVSTTPTMAGFYKFVGVPVHTAGEGLVFQDIKVQPVRHKDKSRSLMISGVIVNNAKRSTLVPVLKAQATQIDGTVLNEWYVMPDKKKLSSSEAMPFETQLADASKNIDEVKLQFSLSADEDDFHTETQDEDDEEDGDAHGAEGTDETEGDHDEGAHHDDASHH